MVQVGCCHILVLGGKIGQAKASKKINDPLTTLDGLLCVQFCSNSILCSSSSCFCRLGPIWKKCSDQNKQLNSTHTDRRWFLMIKYSTGFEKKPIFWRLFRRDKIVWIPSQNLNLGLILLSTFIPCIETSALDEEIKLSR